MPIYEYQCRSCGHRFERIQKFSDPPETVCSKCGAGVDKLISSPAIQFKGSGFYITDYAKPGQAARDGKDAPADAAGKDGAAAKPSAETPKGAKGAKGDEAASSTSAAKSDAPKPKPSTATE